MPGQQPVKYRMHLRLWGIGPWLWFPYSCGHGLAGGKETACYSILTWPLRQRGAQIWPDASMFGQNNESGVVHSTSHARCWLIPFIFFWLCRWWFVMFSPCLVQPSPGTRQGPSKPFLKYHGQLVGCKASLLPVEGDVKDLDLTWMQAMKDRKPGVTRWYLDSNHSGSKCVIAQETI